MFREWLIKYRAKREAQRVARRRNYQLLQHVADAVLGEYNSLPYTELAGPRNFVTEDTAIVNGVWIAWRSEFKKSSNGTMKVAIKLHSNLSKPSAATLTRSILKRSDDAGTRYESLHWVAPRTPTLQINAVQAVLQLPANASKEEKRAALRQNSQFLDQIADAVIDEYESLPYASFVDLEKLSTSVNVIVNGVPISWNFDYQPPRNGIIEVDFDFYSDLPAKGGPARSFLKRPDDAGTLRESLRWVRWNPVFHFDEAETTLSE
jgi:hypothetical protein